MFVIVVYDVNQKRCNKVLKICRKYLQWVQRSVLEGEISEANFAKMEYELNSIIDPSEGDSIVIYNFRTKQYFKRLVYGIDLKEDLNFL